MRFLATTIGAVLAAAATALAGCGDPGTVSVELLAYDEVADEYVIDAVDITTLDDVDRLQGRATKIVGGADITLDYQKNELQRDDPGHAVAFGAFEQDGVLIPEDFDSFAMASAYYNIELSLLFYESLGMEEGALVDMETFYWPDFTLIESDGEETIMEDNAFYMFVSANDRGFYVFPYADFQWLPMSMNGGIMTHEFSHAVFDAFVEDPSRQMVDGGMTLSGANLLYGMNEGIADFMAVARTGDPDYMEHSIEKGVFSVQCNSATYKEIVRDASVQWNYSASIDDPARSVQADAFCPYDVGAFFAAALYAIADGIDTENAPEQAPSHEALRTVARALFESMGDLGQTLTPDFELWDMFGLMVENLGPEHADAACSVLEERYAMYYDQVAGC